MKTLRSIALIIAFVIITFGVILFFQNLTPITVAMLFWNPQFPLSILIAGAFLAGAIIGTFGYHYGRKSRIGTLPSQLPANSQEKIAKPSSPASSAPADTQS